MLLCVALFIHQHEQEVVVVLLTREVFDFWGASYKGMLVVRNSAVDCKLVNF